jgi:ABC-type multidrug transport system fused ATPase/permease subunit
MNVCSLLCKADSEGQTFDLFAYHLSLLLSHPTVGLISYNRRVSENLATGKLLTDNPFQSPPVGTDQNVATPIAAKSWRYIPLKTLTLLATISLAVYSLSILAGSVVVTVGSFMFDTWNDLNADFSSDFESLLAMLALVSVVLMTISYLFTAVIVCMFMYRANVNLRALGAQGLQNTPGWCGGYWFIPIVNLFMPYKCMSEIHRASQNPTGMKWMSNSPHGLMGIWWTLWITGSFLSRFLSRSEAFDLQQYDWIFQWVLAIVLILAAASLISIMRSITSLQQDHAPAVVH